MKVNCKALLTLLLVLLLSLAGCGQPGVSTDGGQGGTDAMQSDAPKLLQFYDNDGYGVINADGKIIARGDHNYESARIWSNAAGEQVAAMQCSQQMSETEVDQWNNPLTESTRFSFFDPWGNTIASVHLDTPGEAEFFYYDGDISTGCFLVYMRGDSGYKIYGFDGTLLVEQEMRTAPDGYSPDYAADYANMWQNGQLLWVSYSVHNSDWSDWKDYADVYNLDGTPVTLAEDYDSIWSVSDEVTGRQLPYLVAGYNGVGGSRLNDLLAADGSVLVSGITQQYAVTEGLIYCQRGFERGLMDFDGNWIYQESVFTELDD
ncbi:MAG TPA: DUF5046 domain-containing protein [Candidatus Avidehalobacter gallistercoris]|uniref:DUF5046 domain-containing protein n=1 Tax=Candidatus Avidehalobacter gallistercoris TaxID=2840694 RepID=A0A9D1HJU6_9FIRM|nr:DUF5046 domain-containing protein [Candidatus Avidehalobacter gallistercoris]